MLESVATIFVQITTVHLVRSNHFVNAFVTDHRDSVRFGMTLDLLWRPLFRPHFFYYVHLYFLSYLARTGQTLLANLRRIICITSSVSAIYIPVSLDFATDYRSVFSYLPGDLRLFYTHF